VESVEQAQQLISETKKKYYDAKHVCFAYRIENVPEIQRFGDDGEPSGTAGKPMLDVLLGAEISNAMILCARYFGGTLLGTGGLVRAYQQAAKECVENASIGISIPARKLQITSNYEDNGKIQYQLEQNGWKIDQIEYLEQVNMNVNIAKKEVEGLKNILTEITAGRVKINDLGAISIIENR
jgi:uncharacterized YigZ family protein